MKEKFTALYSTNFWGVFNDSFLKTLASFIAITWVDKPYQSYVVSAAAAFLVLPYLFISPLASQLTNLRSKKHIIQLAKIAELPIMVLAIAGFMMKSMPLVLGSILLMGLQSALYSPAKYSLIRDIGGKEGISKGMGGMEAIAFLGILLGTVAGSFLAEKETNLAYGLLLLFALIGLLSSYFIRAKETIKEEKNSINPLRFMTDVHQKLKAYPGINTIIYTLSIFWWMAASLQIGLLIYCKQVLGFGSFETGLVLSIAAVGIMIGSVLGGFLDKNIYLLGYNLLFGWILSALFFILFFVPLSNNLFTLTIFSTSLIAGLFKLPLDAEIQKQVKGPFINTVLAYFNQVSFIFILFASLTFAIITYFFNSSYLFLMLGIVFIITPLYLAYNYRPVICHLFKQILHLRYKVSVIGLETLNVENNCIVLPSHAAVVDPMILMSEFYATNLQPLVDETYFKHPISNHILSLFNAILVPDVRRNRQGISKAKALKNIAVKAINNGNNLFFYPSGHITLDGKEQIGGRFLAHQVCRELPNKTQIICIKTYGLWGSMWSRYERDNTPPMGINLAKSIGLILSGAVLLKKKRTVTIELVNMTTEVKKWAQEEKLVFNQHLEDFYNK